MPDLKPCPFCGGEIEERGGKCNYGKKIMRLIDAKAFAEHLERLAHTARTTYPNLFHGLFKAVEYVKDFPAVDAVPVVRCKDCKYHEDEEIGMVYCPNALGGWVAENWFCAEGEQKEGQA